MPNYVLNQVSAPEHVITAMLDENNEVDFNKTMPYPAFFKQYKEASFATFSNEAIDRLVNYVKTKRPNWVIKTGLAFGTFLTLDKLCHSDGTKLSRDELYTAVADCYTAKDIDSTTMSLLALTETGYCNVQEWTRANWGTKWNASDSEVIEGLTNENWSVFFFTAWNCPDGYLENLSKLFPDTDIYVTYADEDIGNNCGEFVLKNGVVSNLVNDNTHPDHDWQEFACQFRYGASKEAVLNGEEGEENDSFYA